jgi:multidrug efflux pump subunit AcrA (membrane-fusion protein)
MLAGRVELKVRQFDRVKKGTLLWTLDSPEWRKLQHEATEGEGEIKIAEAAEQVALALKAETEKEADLLEERIAKLAELNVRRVDLEADLASLRNKLPRLEAECRSNRVKLSEARAHLESGLRMLASMTGLSIEELRARWRTIDVIETHAKAPGVVDRVAVTNGAWIETGGLVLATADPTAIRFRALAPQSDMTRFRDGQHVQIVPPQGGSIDLQDVMPGKLTVSFRAHPEERTIPLYVTLDTLSGWAKPGVSAYLEVFVEGDEEPQLAIPRSCVVRDKLALVFFRRNPKDKDEAVRVEADMGPSDGRWVVIKSGIREGDEIVLDGVYELQLATATDSAQGGHFHADGTFHEEEH